MSYARVSSANWVTRKMGATRIPSASLATSRCAPFVAGAARSKPEKIVTQIFISRSLISCSLNLHQPFEKSIGKNGFIREPLIGANQPIGRQAQKQNPVEKERHLATSPKKLKSASAQKAHVNHLQ